MSKEASSLPTEPQYLFSIITVCRNAAKTIENTLQSVALQEKVTGLVEHIVVDGASEDDTLDIVQQFPDIHWISESDNGISDAFNKGLHLASGTYVLYLNADDYLYDQTVLHDVASFVQGGHKPDWVVGDVMAAKKGAFTFSKRRYPPSCWSLMFRNRIGHQSVFLKRRVLLKIGGFETRFKTAMDYDLFERLCARGYKPVYFPRIISVFSEEGLTSVRTPALVKETEEVAARFRNNRVKRLAGYAYDRFRGVN